MKKLLMFMVATFAALTLNAEIKTPATIFDGSSSQQEEYDADVVFSMVDFKDQGVSHTGGEVKATKDGVTFWCDKAWDDGQYGVRCYKGGKIKISSEGEQIGKLVFEFGLKNGGLDETVVVNAKEWNYELPEQARFSKIKVYFGTAEEPKEPELPDGVINCAAAVELAASIQDPTEPKATVEGDAVKIRGYVTFAYDAKDGKQSVWLADKKGSKSGVLQGAYLEITDAVVVGDYVEIEGTLAKYLKEGKDGIENEVIIEVINGTMRKAIGGKFIISTFVTPENSGQVIVEDNILTAKANDGYHFVQWNDGNTDNPRTVELTKDTTFTAEFAIDTSGSCGKDNLLTWTYDTQARRLTISGNGSFDENMTCGLEAKENMVELVIEEGVTTIGRKAFENSTNLTSVEIPNSVTSIGDGAFSGCSNLTLVKLNSNAIVSKDYSNNYDNPTNIRTIFGSQVTEYIIGNGVTGIGLGAFSSCSNMTSVTLPNSVTRIGGGAFWKCLGLTSVTIPNGVTNIEGFAFDGCTGLTSVEIPNSITNIENYAFAGCSGLISITIPESITRIGRGAFSACSGLESVIWNAINCADLTGSIGENPFGFGQSITSFIFGNKVKTIPVTLCYGCSGLSSIEIPNSVTSIGDWAFDGCTNLTSVTIPNSVISIVQGAFRKCSSLTSIEIPNSVTSIGDWAFLGCSGLTSVTIPNSVISIGQGAFFGCSNMNSVKVSQNVTSIEYGTFRDCTGLTSVEIPNSVTSIGNSAFYNCSSLTSIEIPNSVSNIGYAAFYGCTGLPSIEIPNSVTIIGDNAFYNCTGLTSVEIPNSVTSIGNFAFYGCSGLTAPIFNEHIFACLPPSYYGAYAIPNGIEYIAGGAFGGCSVLTSIEIPNSVTNIGEKAFYKCTGLTSIIWKAKNCKGYYNFGDQVESFTFGNDLKVIPASICFGMDKLTSIEIPNSVTIIEEKAFYGCSHITELTLGKNLQSIGSEAFASCKRIADINCYAKSVPDIQANTFNDVSRKAYVWVAADQIRKYETDAYWGEFFIKTKEAEQATTSTVQVTSHETTADVVWPSVENAASYELVIKDKNGNAVCTLIFNANGQLTEIAFSAPSRDNAPQQPQAAGFAFTITGLNSGTGYDLIITSKDKDGETLDEQTLSFTTQGDAPQSLDQITNDQLQTNKVIHNGQLLILRGDNTYTLTGQQVK